MPPSSSLASGYRANDDGPPALWRENLFAYAVIFTFLFLTHAPLLRLPYFWDEAGYFIPAARDFLLTGSLIPHTTLSNAHPPLLMIWLAFWWKFSAFSPAVTRVAMLLVAAFALLGLWRLARTVANIQVAAATVLCTALYPVFFAQSSLAHLDMMAAAFTLWGLAMYVEQRPAAAIVFLALAPLAKETAIVTPLALLGWELLCPVFTSRTRANVSLCFSAQKPWKAFRFLLCLVPIVLWFSYHHHQTGYYLGNPEYLRYNLGATITPWRVAPVLLTRLWQILGYLNLFVLTLATAYAMSRPALVDTHGSVRRRIPVNVQLVFAVIIAAYVVALSISGGAVLARYMLPAVPLVILVCVSTLYRRIRVWRCWILVTCGAFILALLTPPPYRVAPEDTLLYRDYILVHKLAADELAARYPRARVLTAWPASDELTRPFLGYVKQPLAVVRIENFSASQMDLAAQAAGAYDVALVFSTKWTPPHPLFQKFSFSQELRDRYFDDHQDVSPQRAAASLGGHIVSYVNRNNEWEAIIAIDKIEDAAAHDPLFPSFRSSAR